MEINETEQKISTDDAPKEKPRGGKRAGAGRKSRAEEMGLQGLLDKKWKMKDREKAIEMLAARASKGDMQAIVLLLSYTYGKPKEKMEVTGKDGKEFTVNVTIKS